MLALFAAYVVALQALVLPLTVAAFAMPEAGLCVTVAGEVSPPPVSHNTGCACAAGCGMQCCAQSFAAPPEQSGIALRAAQADVVVLPHATLVAVPSSDGTPHSPRAPPAA